MNPVMPADNPESWSLRGRRKSVLIVIVQPLHTIRRLASARRGRRLRTIFAKLTRQSYLQNEKKMKISMLCHCSWAQGGETLGCNYGITRASLESKSGCSLYCRTRYEWPSYTLQIRLLQTVGGHQDGCIVCPGRPQEAAAVLRDNLIVIRWKGVEDQDESIWR